MYDSLEAPVYVWDKVHTTKDLSHLLINKIKITKKISEALQKAFDKMFDEYLVEFKLPESTEDILRKKIEIAIMETEMVMTGDRSNETFIEIANIELKEMEEDMEKLSKGSSFIHTKIAIQDKAKYPIDIHKTSIREFYNLVKFYSKN